MRRVILIRHTQVAAHWQPRCYGQSDAGLSRAGRAAAHAIAKNFEIPPGCIIVASPLRRARFMGALLAQRLGTNLIVDPALAERNFGSWERQLWIGIYAETGSDMMGLITAPDTFRPGGGETTTELQTRAVGWLHSLNYPKNACVVAIAHGGPIAAIRASLNAVPVEDWLSLVPDYGEQVEFEL